jgi:hypothetical protein
MCEAFHSEGWQQESGAIVETRMGSSASSVMVLSAMVLSAMVLSAMVLPAWG